MPWATPTSPPYQRWMQVGFQVFETLGPLARTIEIYPHAIFRTLARKPIPPKSTRAGLAARVELLTVAGINEPNLIMWDTIPWTPWQLHWWHSTSRGDGLVPSVADTMAPPSGFRVGRRESRVPTLIRRS